MREFCVGLLFLVMLARADAQVLINELSARNYQVYQDEFGKYEDWIELHNTADTTVNLLGWTISDRADEQKFEFPDYSMSPGEYLVVLASDRDLKHVVHHWETPVKAGDEWKYLPTDDSVAQGWMNPEFNDSTWQTGIGGFGRGNGDDSTLLADTISKVFIRKKFSVPDTSKIDGAFLHVDYDDAFVAYLNGQEIARDNVGCPGVPIEGIDYAGTVHKAQMYQGGLPDSFRIKKNELAEKLRQGENTLAIAGVNAWNNHGDFSLIPFLSFGIRDTSQFFEGPPEWFSVSPYHFHANFKLDGEGETVFLRNNHSELIDKLGYTDIVQTGHSIGRKSSEIWEIQYFNHPTPGEANSEGEKNYTTKPYVTVESGFYEDSLEVRILSNMFESTIYYSLDGTPPDTASPVYQGPLMLDSTVVLRARAFVDGYLPGEIVTKTYLINEDVELPVFSISMDPYLLWDWEEGMYVKGPDAASTFPFYGANFWNDWERPAHVEYFNDDHEKVVSQPIGLKIHGSVSRGYDQKSLRLNARGIYGDSRMRYKFFPGKDDVTYKKLVLRNSGQDFNKSHFRDGIMNKMVQNKTHIDNMAYKPTVVFLNGRYWGIHNMREKIGKWYIGDNHPEVDFENLDVLVDNFITIEGDYVHYWHMIDFLEHTMVFGEQDYDSLRQLLDIKNYTDYFIAEMYYSNIDWPNNNIKYWREKEEGSRWRYIMFDLDPGMNHYGPQTYNMLNKVLNTNIPYTHNHIILRRMLEYGEYEKKFINRFADLLNTIFRPENVQSSIDSVLIQIEDEMPRHMEKWDGSMTTWQNNVDEIREFGNERPAIQRQHIIDEFSLDHEVTLTVKTIPEGTGEIKVSTVTPPAYPWSGIYFDGNPVPVEAIGKEGYMFSHWERSDILSDTLTPAQELSFDTSDTLIAHFIEDTIPDPERKLTISEINYRSADSLDAEDWIELHNYGQDTIDLGEWWLKDGDDTHIYEIPFGTILPPDSFLVISRNPEKFHEVYPGVDNVIGPFDFGFSSDGEQIRLFDENQELFIDMTYGVQPPWPDNVSGTGRTLELVYPSADLSDPASWFAGCIGGSPGGPYEECEKQPEAEEELTAMESEDKPLVLRIYPNPAGNYLHIAIPDGYKHTRLEMYDLYGRRVMEKPTLQPGRNTLHTRRLKGGVYILRLQLDETKVQRKIVVE